MKYKELPFDQQAYKQFSYYIYNYILGIDPLKTFLITPLPVYYGLQKNHKILQQVYQLYLLYKIYLLLNSIKHKLLIRVDFDQMLCFPLLRVS
jgi:hypothetical protein